MLGGRKSRTPQKSPLMKIQRPLLALAATSTIAVLAFALAPRLQDMPQPTDEHKHMLAGVGEWEGTVTMLDMPGSKPEPAVESVKAVGGFWILSDFHSSFMGLPYHGSGHIGYDPMKKKYVGTWVDSMSSTFSLMEGEVDPKTHTLVMRWMAPDMTGTIVPHRSESIANGDTRTMTFYSGTGEGKKSMVIEMKRKAGKAAEAGATK